MSDAATAAPHAATGTSADALRLLHEPGEVFEVRILNTARAGTVSGYFDDPAAAAVAIAKWDGKAPGLYATLNPVTPDLLARACNRLAERARTTTNDGDVSRRRWLLVDVDAERPAGISASDAEWQAAHELAAVICADLGAAGWPVPVVCDSGNGAHLLYRVDLPNDDDARELVSRCLAALAARFNTDGVHVDTAVFNAARIAKVPGTLVCKGDSTPTRPHRRAALLTTPATLDAVPVALLAALAKPQASAAAPQAKPAPGNGNGARYGEPFDVEGFMARHGLAVRKHKTTAGADLWELDACPVSPEHEPGKAYIGRKADGTLYAGCQHATCELKSWAYLRERLEPRPVTDTAPAPAKAKPPAPQAAAIAAAAEDGPAGPKPAPTPTLYPLTDRDGAPGPALAALWAAEAEAARAARLSGRPRGPVTGFAKLDTYLGGYLRSGLHFVHGEPGSGKTAYGLQVAATCGCPALFVSTEMSPIALARRIVARVTDTYEGKMDDGEKSPAVLADLFAYAARACPMLTIMDAATAYAAAAAIRIAAEDLRDAHPDAGGRVLVVLDSLHTWAGADPGNGDAREPSEYESLNRALGRLQGLAAALEAPVLVVAERNRPSMASAGQSAAKGTARIEYCAESIVSLNRVLDTATNGWECDARGEYPLYAKVAKNRAGRTGPKVQMRFNGALARLREA